MRDGIKELDDFRKMSIDQLYETMAGCQSPGYYQLAVEELQRRYLLEVGHQTASLVEATNGVHREVAILADSSGKVEKLTVNLRTLTIWLIIFAGLQILIAVVQTWKMFRAEPSSHAVATVTPPPAPVPGSRVVPVSQSPGGAARH